MQGQALAKPRLRQDLVAEAIEESGARFIDVMDPEAGTVYRFYEVEYSIACAMDGERDVAGIVRWAQEELGLTPSPNEVRSVITALGDLGYLDSALGAEQPAAPAAEQPAARPAATTPSAPLPVAAKSTYDDEATSIGNLSEMAPAPAAAGPATVARLQLKRTPASGMPAQKPLLNKDPRRDDDLAPGVLVGSKSTASVEAGDFELGASGGQAPAAAAPPVAAIEAPSDLELGASGTSSGREETAAEVIDIPLGVSGPGAAPAASPARDVSLDLSDQMAVGLADVKEAVRASKVIEAVEEPKAEPVVEKPAAKAATPPATPPARPSDKAIAKPVAPPVPKAAEKPAEAKAAEKPAAKAAEKPAAKAAEKPAAKAAEKPAAKAAEKPAAKATDKPATKPTAKPAVEAPRAEAAKPIAPSTGNQRRMVLLFLLLLAVAGAFFVWHYNLLGHKTEPVDDTSAMPIRKKPAPPPAPEVQKLAASQVAAQELKPGMTGPIDMIVADGTTVAAGAVIATIGGHERLDKAVADEQKDLAKIPDELAGYEKERDAALAASKPSAAADKKIKDANDRLEQHKQTLATRQSELDKYQIKAPVAGKVTAMSKVGARVTPADVVASLAPTPSLTATFKLPAGMSLSSDAPVRVQRQADKQELICAAAIDSGAVKVTCDGALAAEGDAITLLGQAPPSSAPAAGSAAAGSAAASGSAAAASGSAAAASGSAAAASGSAAAASGSAAAAAGSAAVAPRPRPRPRPRPTPTPTPDNGGGDTTPTPTPAPAPTPAPDPTPANP